MSIFIPGAKKVKSIFASVPLPKVNEFALFGKARQNTTSGKNLLENAHTSKEINGVTFTVNENDGSVTVNGTATALSVFDLSVTQAIPNGKYILSGCPSGGSGNTYGIYVNDLNDTSLSNTFEDIGANKEITIENGGIYRPRVIVRSGVTVNNLVFKPMISVEGGEYEPFTNGASPNPQFPQPIEVSGESGSVEVKSCGSQLFNSDNCKMGYYSKDGIFNNSVVWNYFEFVPIAENCTLSGITTLGGSTVNIVGFVGDKVSVIKSMSNSTFDTKGYDKVGLSVHNDDINNAMLNYGTVALPYEPYKETLSTIPTENGLAGIKVSANGNYTDQNGQQWICDEIVKYADGSGKRIHRIKKVRITKDYTFVLNNNWIYSDKIANDFKELLSNASYKMTKGICSHFKYSEEPNYMIGNIGTCCLWYGISYNGYRLGFNGDFATVEEFKTFLDENEVYFYYPLAEPIVTPLTAEEIAEIDKLATFDEVTVSNDADCDMSISFGKYYETKKIVSAWANKDGLPMKVFSSGIKGFVAVGDNNRAYYSLDSENWTAMSGFDSSIRDYNGVTYGKGRFVCVGSYGNSYYSIDGENWIAMSGLESATYMAVTYGNGRFICVGTNGNSYYSLDGETWVAMSGLASATYYCVTYGNGRFICIGASGNSYYSLDGETWTAMTGLSSACYGVTYGNGKFVCVGGKAYYSLNGETWTAASGLASGNYKSVVYGNGRFVCVGVDGSSYYSSDGVTWNIMRGLSSASDYKGVTYGNGKFICVGGNSKYYYLTDGAMWNEISGSTKGNYTSICYSVDGGYGD